MYISKKQLKEFYEAHPLQQFSAARLEYSLYYHPEMLDMAKETFQYTASDVDVLVEAQIEGADADALLRLMRKRMSGDNKSLLRRKLVDQEEAVVDAIKKRALTSARDEFIENALNFFLHCKGNYTQWIIENYQAFRSPYLRSMFCLVLGIRGDEELLPFMMLETERMEREFKGELFSQGPLLAVHDLGIRFLDMDE